MLPLSIVPEHHAILEAEKPMLFQGTRLRRSDPGMRNPFNSGGLT